MISACSVREDDLHDAIALGRLELGHLLDVAVPDHPAQGRVVGFVRPHHAAVVVLPEDLAARFLAEHALLHATPRTACQL